jgi:hypothetical protein
MGRIKSNCRLDYGSSERLIIGMSGMRSSDFEVELGLVDRELK